MVAMVQRARMQSNSSKELEVEVTIMLELVQLNLFKIAVQVNLFPLFKGLIWDTGGLELDRY